MKILIGLAVVAFLGVCFFSEAMPPLSRDAYLRRFERFLGEVRENHGTGDSRWWDRQDRTFRRLSGDWRARFEAQFRLSERILTDRLTIEYGLLRAKSDAAAVRDIFVDDYRRLREAIRSRQAR